MFKHYGPKDSTGGGTGREIDGPDDGTSEGPNDGQGT